MGPYEILSPLGAGGMGEVYRARDTRLGRDVAIKVLPHEFTDDRERLARFEREARLLASLNHPNIATIHGFENVGDLYAIVMEVVEGETLADKLAGSGLSALGSGRGPSQSQESKAQSPLVAESLGYARQIIDALDVAHERGIVHRDLKPANIKITPDGLLKVLDFGLAKADTGSSNVDLSQSPTLTSGGTRSGVILGTAAYMSPEQARGKPVDKRTDIWAFGCVLFEMLTGHLAFPGETVSDTIGAILHKQPDWDALPASVSPRIRSLLMRCLDKDARQRLRDIGDARHELDALPEVSFVPTSSDVHVARAALPWGIAVLSVAVAAGAIVRSSRAPANNPAIAPVLSPAIRVTNTPDSEFGPAISPDGKWVAYYATVNGRTDVMVKFLDNGSTLNLTGSLNMELSTRAGQGGVAISPDGSSIAFGARSDSTIPQYDTWIVPGPVGGAPRKILATIGSVQWSPDGKQLAFTLAGGTAGDGLGVSDSYGTNQRVLVPREGGRHLHWPAWSRDGRHIYFIYTYDAWHEEPAETYRVAAAGGKPEPVVQSVRRAIYPAPLQSGALLFAGNPNSLDLGLWWQRAPGSQAVALSNGVGEHVEPRVSSDGKRVVATLMDIRRSLVSIPASGSGPWQVLTDGRSGDIRPSVDVHTGRIVFSSARSGHRNLWIMDADGGHPTPLTTEAAIDDNPTFSPDGQQIAFVSDRGGQRAIWVMSTHGGAPRRLAAEIVLDTLSWSPDGGRIFFAKPNGDLPALASVTVGDGHVEAVGFSDASAPAWSPKGDVLAFLEVTLVPAPNGGTGTVSRIYTKFVDSQGKVLYPNVPRQTFPNALTAWSPDGTRLAVLAIAGNGPGQIWIVEPNGRQPLRKLVDFPPAQRPRGLTWSKDGDRIIIANQEYSSDIVLYDLN